ncbi:MULTISPECIES: TatD family hydrolase [unclassified Vibrio]|uniref:TatD family hydrolase n=1 Tax=Vibrio sp. HB236076 TaxID=3232307 RepID=A0AB39H9I2_9VIBR|nr:TatD family hydrolase [Vibrio sp. HB161653]MDP5254075.1 TatD family hydrolase [Vibrio sp. HB161653]
MSPLFDTHCHLDRQDRSALSLDSILEQAQQVGVNRFMLPACFAANWQEVVEITKHNEGVYCALGLHPYFIEHHQNSDLDRLATLLESREQSKCVAVGEMGLDFYHSRDTQEKQTFFFQQQVKLANRYQLPGVIHNRKASQDIVKLLRRTPLENGGVVHGFTGSLQEAKQFIDLGMMIGVGGSITYLRAQKTRHTIASLPLECLVLETDAPDMPLSGRQGQENYPFYLPQIFEHLVALRSESKQVIAEVLWANSHRLFSVK